MIQMGNFIFSILFGLLPEVIYFTLFLILTKNLKEKRIKLFLLIAISYILCIMLIRYKLLLYTIFIFIVYIILKILYKDKASIIDIFTFAVSTLYLTIMSYLFYKMMVKYNANSFICYLGLRIVMFLPLIFFRNVLNKIYQKYCSLWNRNDKEKRPIKSITLRNISLIFINIFIIVAYFSLLFKLNNI